MKKLSVVIITWNSERYVESCLRSVWMSLENIEHEIILVDNGSTDGTRSVLEKYAQQDHVSYFPQTENLGVAKARNIGMQASCGEYIWLLDIDTEVNPEAIREMLSFMDTHPDCGICGCKLLNTNNLVQDSCRKYPSLRYKALNVFESMATKLRLPASWKDKLAKMNASQFYHAQMLGQDCFEVEYLIGACQLIRKDVVQQIGQLDEHIFYGPEDADYCQRAFLAGWKIFYIPYVSFWHDYQKITNKRLFSKMSWVHVKALLYYFWKYRKF